MAAAFSFAVPSAVPQDLQMIHDIIGDLPEPSMSKLPHELIASNEHGTDSDTDSEGEVEADITAELGEETGKRAPSSESSSDSDSSSDSEADSDADADSDSEPVRGPRKPTKKQVDVDDNDDEGEPVAAPDAQMRTKNEMVDVDVKVPEITKVEPEEHLERVGEVFSVFDKVAIVKGLPSPIANRGSERALDSETLLVFEDRTVLGYVFETFGPTSEPLYQLRFSQAFPLDTAKVQVGRPVFHVPSKSVYVFVQQLKHFKGSDASNVHDEEPGDDELEFSDDEQEAAQKKAKALRREASRSRSLPSSSRHSTPVPSRMRDQDMVDDPYGGTTYDSGLSYNDMDLGAGPSRPAPIPYDDPYSDAYGIAPPPPPEAVPKPEGLFEDEDAGEGHLGISPVGKMAGGVVAAVAAKTTVGAGADVDGAPPMGCPPKPGMADSTTSHDEYDPYNQGPPSPTSLAIARATGQYSDGMVVNPPMGAGGGWNYPQYNGPSFDFSFPYQYPHVQPHINPRFAAQFGVAGMGTGLPLYGDQNYAYSQDANGYAVGGSNSQGWNQNWGPGSSQMPPHHQGGA